VLSNWGAGSCWSSSGGTEFARAGRGCAGPSVPSLNSAPAGLGRRGAGILACLYSWSALQVVQRVCFTWSSIIATTA
jgi:hypothetical protein